jgi:hypothetical protein
VDPLPLEAPPLSKVVLVTCLHSCSTFDLPEDNGIDVEEATPTEPPVPVTTAAIAGDWLDGPENGAAFDGNPPEHISGRRQHSAFSSEAGIVSWLGALGTQTSIWSKRSKHICRSRSLWERGAIPGR